MSGTEVSIGSAPGFSACVCRRGDAERQLGASRRQGGARGGTELWGNAAAEPRVSASSQQERRERGEGGLWAVRVCLGGGEGLVDARRRRRSSRRRRATRHRQRAA
jgi:hypothetical protein